MSEVFAPLAIEIIDPVAEPPHDDRVNLATCEATTGHGVDWMSSFVDACGAASRRFDPARRLASGVGRRMQTVMRAVDERSAQLRVDGNPRRNSAVRHHMFEPVGAVAGRLPAPAGPMLVGPGVTLELTSGFRPTVGGGHEASATLSLRGSWPRLPVVVRIEPWWREQSRLTVELRSRRRFRYPRRYFRSAHAAAGAFVAELGRRA